MTPELKAELLHLITHERGSTTKQLFAAINVLRLPENNLWQHKEPEDQPALQLMLFSLAELGQIVNVAGTGWLITSQVPTAGKRRGFEVQKLAF